MTRITAHQRTAHTVQAMPHSAGALQWVNSGLAFAAVGMLLYYVVQVNLLAGLNWQMRTAQDRLAALGDQRNALVAQQSTLDDRQALTVLADRQGLVPASAITYLVQDHSVAAR